MTSTDKELPGEQGSPAQRGRGILQAMRLTPDRRRALVRGLASGIVAAGVVAAASIVGLSTMSAVVPVAIVVATVIGAATLIAASIARVSKRVERVERTAATFGERWPEIDERLSEIAAISQLSSVDVPYPLPLGGWAFLWDAAVILAQEIAVAQPRVVVELGSGASSLVVGQLLRRLGAGHVYSLEHDSEFARTTRRHVSAMGLDEWVTIFDAALTDQIVSGEQFRWYTVPDDVQALSRIDVLIVDGPPQSIDYEGTPRYPALPVFAGKLGPGSIVFVDDGIRAAEKRMLTRWEAEQPHWTRQKTSTRRRLNILRWKTAADAGAEPVGAATTHG
jgi:hypothetical protein